MAAKGADIMERRARNSTGRAALIKGRHQTNGRVVPAPEIQMRPTRRGVPAGRPTTACLIAALQKA